MKNSKTKAERIRAKIAAARQGASGTPNKQYKALRESVEAFAVKTLRMSKRLAHAYVRNNWNKAAQ